MTTTSTDRVRAGDRCARAENVNRRGTILGFFIDPEKVEVMVRWDAITFFNGTVRSEYVETVPAEEVWPLPK